VTPSARVQAAIDILDAVIDAARGQGASADRIAAEWFRARRFVGSKDRRAIRDLVWNAIRVCGDVPVNGRAAMLRLAKDDTTLTALFDGSTYGPALITADEIGRCKANCTNVSSNTNCSTTSLSWECIRY